MLNKTLKKEGDFSERFPSLKGKLFCPECLGILIEENSVFKCQECGLENNIKAIDFEPIKEELIQKYCLDIKTVKEALDKWKPYIISRGLNLEQWEEFKKDVGVE